MRSHGTLHPSENTRVADRSRLVMTTDSLTAPMQGEREAGTYSCAAQVKPARCRAIGRKAPPLPSATLTARLRGTASSLCCALTWHCGPPPWAAKQRRAQESIPLGSQLGALARPDALEKRREGGLSITFTAKGGHSCPPPYEGMATRSSPRTPLQTVCVVSWVGQMGCVPPLTVRVRVLRG